MGVLCALGMALLRLPYATMIGALIAVTALIPVAAVTIGGGIMGVAGMLLSVPIASALYRILREDLNKKPSPVRE